MLSGFGAKLKNVVSFAVGSVSYAFVHVHEELKNSFRVT